ncbi:MAG TPA: ShlB/FhaC/HecB family hemolysin secretion/activation protein [Chitinophagaceae bacterium]
MKNCYSNYKVILFLLCSCAPLLIQAQQDTAVSTKAQNLPVAGPQYDKSRFHQKLWGKHYRKEWTTPVNVPRLYLDTAMGGLVPYRADSASQTRTLRLRTTDNKEYVLRSIDKSYESAMPEIYRNTFLENIANDQVSSIHPYSAVTIPPMAAAAGVYHTQPVIRFVPKQSALGEFNNDFGDKLYMLEERPDGNWEEAENLGNAQKLISTEKLLQELLRTNNSKVNQEMYVRARLFDMVIGDWSRGEDQWRWIARQQGEKINYEPVPRDRDQAYTKYDGALLRFALSAAGLGHIETYRGNIDDITTFNYSARNLDRRMANECDLQTWVDIAKELQQALTNEIIETAVKQLPPEVLPVSGESIIYKLKARRDKLADFAARYYRFLAKEVDIPGTAEPEQFEITRLNGSEIKLSIYRLQSDGNREATPVYERTFQENVTKEIRVYGIAGNDTYQVNGEVKNDIDVVLVGGSDKDVYKDASGSKNETHIYDNFDNSITSAQRTRIHLSKDEDVHNYRYDAFVHDKKGLKPAIFFSNYDRFYLGLGYEITKQGWRKEPFAYKHGVYARYSLNQNAVSFEYEGILNQIIGKWDLLFSADYDALRWTNYFGIGNETVELDKELEYYRVRTREIFASVSLNRRIGADGYFRLTPFYQGTKVRPDADRFIAQNTHSPYVNSSEDISYQRDDYAGITMSYLFADVDDVVVTRKGVTFTTAISHIKSLESNRSVNTFSGGLNFYIPVSKNFIFSSRNGFSTLTGDPKFYQLPVIGGSLNLRGYRRDRFRGNTTFFNNNELQYLFNVKSSLYNGAFGPMAFYDIGRVWQPGEDSDVWHSGYGAGIMIAPFNRAMISVAFGISNENKVLHLRLSRAF